MHRLRRPLQAVSEALEKEPPLRARAAEALGHALLLRFGELAAEMGDVYNMDEQHGAAVGADHRDLAGELVRRVDAERAEERDERADGPADELARNY